MKTVIFEDVRVVALTDMAVLIDFGDDETWVPLSVIDLDDTSFELERESEGNVAIAEWFATKKGLS